MLQDERDLGRAGGKLSRALHLAGKHLQVEAPVIVGKPRDIALQRRIAGKVWLWGETILRVFMPVQLHAQSAHPAIFRQSVELWTDIVGEEIRVTDNALGKAGLVGGL